MIKRNKYTFAVIAAGALWGFMGFFRRTLDSMGISAMGCISVRCGVAAVLFAVIILLTDKKAFRIKLRDLWIFFGLGVMSLLVFGLCYFKSMDYLSLSNAAILLYTAPCFVILMSSVLFKEKMTAKKLIAMALAFLGCCLVSGIGINEEISIKGIFLGLGAGFCYALFSIFSRYAINRNYSTYTINFYACVLATAGASIIGGTDYVSVAFSSGSNILFAAATGLVTCFLPYLLYTFGLTGLENGKASIMASIEPVVATVCGFFIYNETLTWLNAVGILLVLSAIVMLNVREIKCAE